MRNLGERTVSNYSGDKTVSNSGERTISNIGDKTSTNKKSQKNLKLGFNGNLVKKRALKRTKHELILELDSLEERQTQINEENELEIDRMDKLAKIMNLKERRILESFEKYSKEWNKFMDKTSLKIDRSKDESLFIKNEVFRPKKEIDEMFHMIKTDSDIFGPRFWDLSLRKYNEKQKEYSISLHKKEVEIIRKKVPFNEDIQSSTLYESGSFSRVLSKPSKSESYLNKKVLDSFSEISKCIPYHNDEEYASLAVNNESISIFDKILK
jgi:hypothetical protein